MHEDFGGHDAFALLFDESVAAQLAEVGGEGTAAGADIGRIGELLLSQPPRVSLYGRLQHSCSAGAQDTEIVLQEFRPVADVAPARVRQGESGVVFVDEGPRGVAGPGRWTRCLRCA